MAVREGYVEADGFRIRYQEAGEGTPLVHLHGAGGLRLTPAHELLCRHFRVVAFEMPGFGASPQNNRPEEMARRLYAHPERLAAIPMPDPAIQAKTRPLVLRLRGPDRDAELERRLPDLAAPTLVLFGTLDAVIPPAMGRFYKELIPGCH